MRKQLPETTEPSSAEILRIQRQCDLARDEHRIDTGETQDRIECTAWLERILCSDRTPRFTNIECRGLGAYGLVFAACDRHHQNQPVAIKVLKPSKAAQRVATDRFEFEGKVLSSLQHPNVIKLLETGKIDDIVYHVVELADVGSLATLLSSSDPRCKLTPRQAAWLISKVADALQEAHSMPVLHRDIKPGNILLKACDPLDSEGLGLWPLLTDFGLSKKLDHTSEEPLTNYGEILGTLAYMSPEQVQGKAMRTPSDLFSLGVILHELVYGVHPFEGPGHFQTLSNIVQNSPVKPHRSVIQIPVSLKAVIAKCLQKDSKSRYRSAGELAEDLRRFLRGELVSIATPTPWESFKALTSNHPKLSIFLGTLIASLLTFVLVLNREWRVQRALAYEKGKISDLFLQSMLGTNSSINDAILAGKRVSTVELLRNLEQQYPVLEQAHRLTPGDLKLIRHLEVMSHYMSLCYFIISTRHQKVLSQEMYSKAIEARGKSLEYIGLLREKEPGNPKLEIPMINGLFNMAQLYEKDTSPESPVGYWVSRAISAAEAYLKENPNDDAVLDTLMNAKFINANILARNPKDLDECIGLFETIVKTTISAYQKHSHRNEFLILHILAVTKLGTMLLESNRVSESDEFFQILDRLIADPAIQSIDDWRVHERLLATYPLRSRALLSTQHYQAAIDLMRGWEQSIETFDRQGYYDAQQDFYYSKAVEVLRLQYFKWQAVRVLQSDGAEETRAKQQARHAMESCMQNDQFDLQRWIKEIDGYGLPTEAIRQWATP